MGRHQTAWVYPIVALLPMLTAYAFGPDLYASTWLTLVMVVDAAAFAVVMAFGRDRRVAHVAWWWLGFLLAARAGRAGPHRLLRRAVAIVGVLCSPRPALAAVLLTVATWIKVWPAALIAAAIVAVRAAADRGGGGRHLRGHPGRLDRAGRRRNLFSFITQQTGRGLQVESALATFWMWDAFTRRSARSTIYYDTSILTYQLHGQGCRRRPRSLTPLLALVALALLLLASSSCGAAPRRPSCFRRSCSRSRRR